MSVSLQNINAQLSAWASSSAGKAKIDNVIKQYQKNGVAKTQGGSEIMTAQRMRELANEFISVLSAKAGSSAGNGGDGSMPPSVSAHFSSLSAGTPVDLGNGQFSVTISFGDDLSRESLDPSEWPEGVSNIIAIFNNGISASGSVRGVWKGHEDRGEIWSRKNRPGLGFMQAAKEDFESRYGGEYGVQVILGGDYA